MDLIYALVYLLLGVIMYSGNQQYIATITNGKTVKVPAYPPESVPHYVSYPENYPNQAVVSHTVGGAHTVFSTPCHANQVVATVASATSSLQGTASVTYSGQGPPPAYQEKQQPAQAS